MKQMWNQLGLLRSSLGEIESLLRDGGGEERQPAPRKFVIAGENSSNNAQVGGAKPQAPQTLSVWRGQEPAQRIANTILLCAIRDRASQVLLEPGEGELSVRFIIESGERQQKLPSFALAPIVQHFQCLAQANQKEASESEPRVAPGKKPWPANGQLRLSVDEEFYDLQFSPLPTRWGDGVKVQFSAHP